MVIGGTGARVLLRIVAEHADVWNCFAGSVEAYRELRGTLDRHCEAIGRDPSTVRGSIVVRAILRETEQEALDVAATTGAAGHIVGTPAQCVEHLIPFIEAGVGDILIAMRPPYDRETLTRFSTDVAAVLRQAQL